MSVTDDTCVQVPSHLSLGMDEWTRSGTEVDKRQGKEEEEAMNTELPVPVQCLQPLPNVQKAIIVDSRELTASQVGLCRHYVLFFVCLSCVLPITLCSCL